MPVEKTSRPAPGTPMAVHVAIDAVKGCLSCVRGAQDIKVVLGQLEKALANTILRKR